MPQLLTATRILERTMPATAQRLLVYGAIALSYLLSILLGAGTFYGLASFARNPGAWGQLGAVLGLAACIYAVRLARPALFHRVDLIHLAAMVRRLTDQELPSGREQLDYLARSIRSLYPSAKESFACYLKLSRFVFEAFADLSPAGQLGLPRPLAWLQTGLTAAILGKPCAEAILAFAIRGNRLADLRLGAAVFCERYREVFKHALIVSAFVYSLFLFAFWLLLKPAAWVDAALPSDLGLWQYVLALILAYWIKAAFLDPIATAALTISLLQLEAKTQIAEEIVRKWSSRLPSLAQLSS